MVLHTCIGVIGPLNISLSFINTVTVVDVPVDDALLVLLLLLFFGFNSNLPNIQIYSNILQYSNIQNENSLLYFPLLSHTVCISFKQILNLVYPNVHEIDITLICVP